MAKEKAKLKAVPRSSVKPEAEIKNGGVQAEGSSGRSVWSGTLVTGMITIPVQLFTAARGETISFNMIHAECRQKVKQAGYYCPCCVEVEVLKDFEHTIKPQNPGDKPATVEYVAGSKVIMHADDANLYTMKKLVQPTPNLAMVDKDQILKGYEYKNGEFLVVTKEEIDAQKPESGSNIEISGFIDADAINPLYFETSYYLAPDKEISNKSYSVLREGMVKKNRAAVGKVCMRQSENIVFILPHEDGGMVAYTAYMNDEIRQVKFSSPKPVTPAELDAVSKYIDALTMPLDMGQYRDEYRSRIYAMLEAKQKGEKPTIVEMSKPKPVQSDNLIEMFQASTIAVQQRKKKTA